MKDIPGFPGYKMDSNGDVWSNLYGNAHGYYTLPNYKKRKPHFCTYARIHMYKDGIKTSRTLHRIVAKLYVSNPLNLPEVNHKDGNKHNYHPSNLEWGTHAYNMDHAGRTGLMRRGKDHHFTKLTEDQKLEIKKAYKWRVVTFKMLAKKYNVSHQRIAQLINEFV